MIAKVMSQGKGDPIIQAAAIIMLAAACEKGKQAVALDIENKCRTVNIDECVECVKKRVFELADELRGKKHRCLTCKNLRRVGEGYKCVRFIPADVVECISNGYLYWELDPEVVE